LKDGGEKTKKEGTELKRKWDGEGGDVAKNNFKKTTVYQKQHLGEENIRKGVKFCFWERVQLKNMKKTDAEKNGKFFVGSPPKKVNSEKKIPRNVRPARGKPLKKSRV